jgi:hypothetical protein
MSGDIEMNQTSGTDLQRNEYLKDTEVCRDGNEEITRNDFASMVPEGCSGEWPARFRETLTSVDRSIAAADGSSHGTCQPSAVRAES